jgi:spore coat polysaccharide biosynthesis predicted glycosyltransferase SpsG
VGRKIGYGHITRCLSISQALKEAGADVSFIINGDRQMIDILPEIPIDIIDWIRNKNKLLKRLQGVETLLIDSILIDQSFFKQISTIVSNMIFIVKVLL